MIVAQEQFSEDVIVNYCQFVISKYGKSIWNKIAYTKLNSENVVDLIFEYGDILMREVVGLTSLHISKSIIEILDEFSHFHSKITTENRIRQKSNARMAKNYC